MDIRLFSIKTLSWAKVGFRESCLNEIVGLLFVENYGNKVFSGNVICVVYE